MAFKDSYIPYGGYWSTPFCRWQGSFQNLHAIGFAADVTSRALNERGIGPERFDGFVLGITIPQPNLFYGGPWLAGLIGAEHLTAAMVGQACATGAKTLALGAQGIETGTNTNVLVITTDRCSNGPLLAYPNPMAPGATQDTESWVWDNFGFDPFAKNAMLETGENVAKEAGITKEEQDAVTLMRYGQYQDALKDEKAFQRRYMTLPVEVKDARGKKVLATVEGDEGIHPTTPDGLEKLKPVLPNGTISYGSQTHPADGNCGIIVSSREKARELSRDDNIEVKVHSYGEAKTKTGYMAMAVVPAAKKALEDAGVSISDMAAIKTHNPFAVNDIYLSREMDVDLKEMNNYGCSLIYGHPQGPTGTRLIIELIEELAIKGGGRGLFAGCAAGDSAAAVVLEVTVE